MAKTQKKARRVRKPAEPTGVEKTVVALRKKFGEKSALVMREGGFAKVEAVMPTGMEVVDRYLLGIGGLPCGRIIEVSGVEGSGKTTVLDVWMGAAQRDGMKVCFADAENRFDPAWALKVGGLKADDVVQLQPDCLEEFQEQVTFLQANERKPVFFALDSVAAIPTKRELDEGKEIPAEHAAIWAKYMRVLSQRTARRGDIVVLVNQPRNKVGVLYGNPETTFGGRAIKHFAGLRLAVSHGSSVKQGNVHVARYMHLRAEKVAFVPPHRRAALKLDYATGFDDDWSVLEHAKEVGCAGPKSENIGAAREALGWPAKAEIPAEALPFPPPEVVG